MRTKAGRASMHGNQSQLHRAAKAAAAMVSAQVVLAIVAACGDSPSTSGQEITAAECSDGTDNDGDGVIDCADPACRAHAVCAAVDSATEPDATAGRETGPRDDAAPGPDASGADAEPEMDTSVPDSGDPPPEPDASAPDSAAPDLGGPDSGVLDSGTRADSGTRVDSGPTDMGPPPDPCAAVRCDDGLFCNGLERCDAGTCLPPVDSDPCGTLTCDEGTDRCLTACEVDSDLDDDGARAVACGGTDCDDNRPDVHRGATERPADGVDQDCDGMELCFVDADGDGYRTDDDSLRVASTDLSCSGRGAAAGDASPGDCDDLAPSIHPGSAETVGDGIDQSCDGVELCFVDSDGDGYRPNATATIVSSDADCWDPGEADRTFPTGDCDDTSALINPARSEVAADGVDQSCDGTERCFVDGDRDGSRLDATTTVASSDLDCTDPGEAISTAPLDCNDSNASVHRGAVEVCNGLDDDCDGRVDQVPGRLGAWVAIGRSCGSNVGVCTLGTQQCTSGTWGACTGGRGPDPAESCNGLDDDCDGVADEGCACTTGATRACGSDTGACSAGIQTCDGAGHWGVCSGGVGPTSETCNGQDDDCDGTTDEQDASGCIGYLRDGDSDGFPDITQPAACLCGPSGSYTIRTPWPLVVSSPTVRTNVDCNDSNAGINPLATERCDLTDWNCNGLVHEENAIGCTTYYTDFDGDGHGGYAACLCEPTGVFTIPTAGDCCDLDNRTHPGAVQFQEWPDGCGSYDYDCNGWVEQWLTAGHECRSLCGGIRQEGWCNTAVVCPSPGVPWCGAVGHWVDGCTFVPFVPPYCYPAGFSLRQQCR